eukprot:scaffold6362_cov378-Prasinococcus_capsulatus_cf.AAC.14
MLDKLAARYLSLSLVLSALRTQLHCPPVRDHHCPNEHGHVQAGVIPVVVRWCTNPLLAAYHHTIASGIHFKQPIRTRSWSALAFSLSNFSRSAAAASSQPAFATAVSAPAAAHVSRLPPTHAPARASPQPRLHSQRCAMAHGCTTRFAVPAPASCVSGAQALRLERQKLPRSVSVPTVRGHDPSIRRSWIQLLHPLAAACTPPAGREAPPFARPATAPRVERAARQERRPAHAYWLAQAPCGCRRWTLA